MVNEIKNGLGRMFMVAMLVAFMITIVTAQDNAQVNVPTNLQFTCTLNYQIPSPSAVFNLSIYHQNGTQVINNQQATSQGQGSFNYTYTFTSSETYTIKEFCYDGAYSFSNTEFRTVTSNGKEKPDGVVVVMFSLAFIVIMLFLLYEMILCFGHLASLDLDVVDLAKTFGVYFALFALYELSMFYLGNATLDNWLLLFIKIGAFTHVIIPITGFLISITIGSLRKKKIDFGVRRIYRSQKI